MTELLVVSTGKDVEQARYHLTEAARFDWPIGLDVETDTANPKKPDQMRDTLVGAGLSVYPAGAVEASITMYGLWTNDEYRDLLLELLPDRRWYAHNAMYDGTVLRRNGIRLGPLEGDGRIVAYLLGEPEAGLKPLLQQRYNIETLEFHELLAQHGATKISEVPLEAQAVYCGSQDAERCVPLAREMEAELDDRVRGVYRELELPMVGILLDMTALGIRFNRSAAIPLLERATVARDDLDCAVRAMVRSDGFLEMKKTPDGELYRPVCRSCRNGKKKRVDCVPCAGAGKGEPVEIEFNPGSWQQVQRYLYDHLRLPIRRFSENTGEGSTDALALLQLQDRAPVIPLMLARRKFGKEVGYLQGWLEGSVTDGRLHTTFTNTTVVSGRLSSREPNLQNVQLRHRVLLEPDPGYEIIAADYSQLEIRIMAFMSKDPVIIEILRNDPSTPEGDMHIRTAAGITGLPLHAVPSQWRKQAKIVNYLTGYGGQADKLVEGVEKRVLEDPESGLSVPTVNEARAWLTAHRRTYPQYWQWVSWTILRTRELGYSLTAFGRPRFLPDILSPHPEYRARAERQAVNHAIQGTAADLIKMAKVAVAKDEWMSAVGAMLLQVHDEIVAQARQAEAKQYGDRLRSYMELGQPFAPHVDLVVDIGRGGNWRDVHK